MLTNLYNNNYKLSYSIKIINQRYINKFIKVEFIFE